MALDGNVLNFSGVDRTGASDSSAGLQSAMNSDFANFFPPGTYKINTKVTIPHPKIIECFGGSMITGYNGSQGILHPKRTYEQVRFITDNSNLDAFFEVQQPQTWWSGGCFDTQNLADSTIAAFILNADTFVSPIFPLEKSGWGGGIEDITRIGDFSSLRSSSNPGSIGIKINFADQTLDYTYMYFWHFSVQIAGCDYGIIHTAMNPATTGQDSALHFYNVSAIESRSAVWCLESNSNVYNIRHLGGPVFPSSAAAQARASMVIGPSAAGTVSMRDPNFGAQQVGDYHYNEKSMNIQAGCDYKFISEETANRSIEMASGRFWNYNNFQIKEGGAFVLPSATTAQFNDIGSEINTRGKFRRCMVWDSTVERVVVANGANPGDVWRSVTSGIVYTPG